MSCTICTVSASESMRNVHVRMPVNEWLDIGRFYPKQVLPLLVPNIGSTKINDIDNIRPTDTDKENKTDFRNQHTLVSFVIKKKASSLYFDEHVLKEESNTILSNRRTQIAIDDSIHQDTRPPTKRFKN
ncbi:unnamed protein product [Rotaria magnacalcarata]|uniref:Uncharacterized protein n=2 Tax=Rotaria magnacalcarata TaxID=392030 RepID=A0A816XYK9_9BILA|nr:unnamed protein product [Rotaria magnacalcarata]CAF2258534.1 unnamed protein product [Rotaria magnacalcarata]